MLMVFMGMNAMAQEVNLKFKVFGNCDQCKDRIESAAKKAKGVSEADWNVADEWLNLKFDSTLTNRTEIEDKILAVGHDLELRKTSKSIYAELPDCCMYYRELPGEKESRIKTFKFKIYGMLNEENSAREIEQIIYKLNGVKISEIMFSKQLAIITYDSKKVDEKRILEAVTEFHGIDGKENYLVEKVNK